MSYPLFWQCSKTLRFIITFFKLGLLSECGTEVQNLISGNFLKIGLVYGLNGKHVALYVVLYENIHLSKPHRCQWKL